MQKIWREIVDRPITRYVVVGGTVYIFEVAVIVLLQKMNINSVMAVGISFCLGTILSFLLQKLVTFEDKRMQHRVVAWQLVATIGLVMFNFGFTVATTWLFERFVSAVLLRSVALGITTLWNFYLYKHVIFRYRSENPRSL